jgi:hypothetical protein
MLQEGNDLVNKTAAILVWAAEHTASFEYIVKVDTDTLVHPFNLATYLMQLRTAKAIHGVYLGMDCPLAHCPLSRNGTSYMQGVYLPLLPTASTFPH